MTEYRPESCRDKPCYNVGRCRENKYGVKCACERSYTGPRCQQRARSFRGGGWAWFPSLQPCQ
ncbi:neural-cadherin-like [Homalodisca vitripennis]|uniref:neural-cadherin-like n=1 Tax=Homalodisca vitripennis TaxID=197043 RepID=UPI001EEB8DEE|nr:neural-cadherin-like [Homalodisca vitripennis]